jgi:hypothetical protein
MALDYTFDRLRGQPMRKIIENENPLINSKKIDEK